MPIHLSLTVVDVLSPTHPSAAWSHSFTHLFIRIVDLSLLSVSLTLQFFKVTSADYILGLSDLSGELGGSYN